MPIRTLFFDLDDTLLETHEAHVAAMDLVSRTISAMAPAWPPEVVARRATGIYLELEAEMERGEVHYETQMPFRIKTWAQTLLAFGLPADTAEELAHLYLRVRRSHYRLYPDVAPTLDALKAEYRLGMITNGISDLQREKIAATGLERWFETIVVSGEVRSWKPDAGIFRHALAAADARPEESVMLGDNLARDVAGAAALGVHTIWVRRYDHLLPVDTISPGHTLRDLRPLPELIAAWQ